MSHSSKTHEMQPPVQSSGTRRDEYQCWKDVKTETGFSDYLSYLEASDATGPQFERLRKELTSYRSFSEFGEISVLDILNDGSTSVSLGLGRVPPLDSNGDPGTQLLQALRSSPENVTARIVPWLIPWGLGLENPRIIDAVGLGLKIDPLFFDVLVSIMRPTCNKRRLIGSDYVKIGDSVVTVARDYRLEAGAPPVLLVAGSSLGNSDPLDFEVSDWRKYNSDMVEKVVEGGIGGGISLRRSTIDQRSPNYRTSNLYLKLLGKYVYQGQSFGAEDNTLLLTAILPLLHLEILRLRVQSGTIESAFLDVQYRLGKPTLYPNERKTQYYQDLDEQRFWLRRRLERLEESKRGFTKYVHLQQATKWLEVETWQKLDDDIKEAIIEARAREAEARDYMQLQIGNLSISESRKSIQLSNQQIDEAKRGK